MNKQFISIFITGTFIMLLAVSCGKKGDDIPAYATLTITAPTQGQSFISGNPIQITGTVIASGTDDAHLLHEVALTIKSLPDSSIVFNTIYDTHELQSFNIDTTFIPIVASTTNMVLIVQAENHLYKVAVKSIDFTITH